VSVPDERLRVLGRVIRAVRRERDLSQEAVAAIGDVHVNQVGRLERGAGEVRASTVLKIVDGLDVPLSEIVRRYEARLHDSP
jgi:transcriptional regulator with XRE-family HTH domain